MSPVEGQGSQDRCLTTAQGTLCRDGPCLEREISVRRYPYILVVIALLFVAGCATTDDLRRVHGNLDHQIRLTNEKIAAVEQGSVGVKGEIAGLRKED